MIGCAYCGKIIGNENYHSMELIGYWNHVKNKHYKDLIR